MASLHALYMNSLLLLAGHLLHLPHLFTMSRFCGRCAVTIRSKRTPSLGSKTNLLGGNPQTLLATDPAPMFQHCNLKGTVPRCRFPETVELYLTLAA